MEKKRFLFIGNSHTYFNDMPELVRRMCAEAGFCEAEICMQALPYATYQAHLEQETSLRFQMVYGNFDFLILQQAAHSPCPSREETLRDARVLLRQARLNHIQPFQLLPWAEERFPEHQEALNSVYCELAGTEGIPLIPAGLVFERARAEKGLPSLYWRDGEHASPWGSYAVAATIYSCISGRSPIGLKAESLSYAKIDKRPGQNEWGPRSFPLKADACRRLQELVFKCVRMQRQAFTNRPL
ncbi:MAG: hypothetical protein HFE84_05130 [Lachnospiraceae bacterium]|nr:hypothetical protein [Lachnospiraceae bacterium]